jgi:fatty acid desaturase
VTQSSPLNPRAGAVFRYTIWDLVPALLVYIHLALILAFFLAWPSLSWAERVAGACLYALALGWSLDSVAHNFIHNPFFRSPLLNRITEFALSLDLGTPQTMYRFVHMRHHAGNSDRPGPDGQTIDPISIYRYGANGVAEPMLPYVFLQFWRDDGPFTVARKIRAKRPEEARRALQEFWLMIAVYATMAVVHWQFIVLLAPFYYLGQCFSMLIAYYEHLGGKPEQPPAMGVSTYAPLYNLLFLNNGYHAEHHQHPKWHWSKMSMLRAEVLDEQRSAGTRIIHQAHMLGFLEASSWKIPTARR